MTWPRPCAGLYAANTLRYRGTEHFAHGTENGSTFPAPILPPLNSLVAFEAAGRLESFTAAGRELGLTQAAISRQIQQLEGIWAFSSFPVRAAACA